MRGVARILLLGVVLIGLSIFTISRLWPIPSKKPIKLDDILRPLSFEVVRDEANAARLQGHVEQEDKIVVIGRLSTEDTSWVAAELPEWQSAIYTVDNISAPLHTLVNKGRESLPYLTYLVDHYDRLPSVIAFVHPHKEGYPKAWHTDAYHNSNVRALRDLNTKFIEDNGYANLRCNHNPGCPEWIKPRRGNPEPLGEEQMLKTWPVLFGADAKIPDVLATPCCAQFAVSRDQVRKRPRDDYVRWREWVLASELGDEVVGRMWEYLWHIVFGADAVFCPNYRTCQCRLYGRYCFGQRHP